jgi:hypothetical protein
MFGTAAAGLQKLLAQGGTCTVQADSGIRCRKRMLPGKILHRLFTQINGTEDIRVFRFQAIYDAVQAGANLALEARRWLDRSFQFTFPRLKGSVSRLLPPVVINHSVAEQAIKPADSRFARLEIISMLECPEVGCLKNVFGKPGIRDAALDEREEPLSLREKLIEGHLGHRT